MQGRYFCLSPCWWWGAASCLSPTVLLFSSTSCLVTKIHCTVVCTTSDVTGDKPYTVTQYHATGVVLPRRRDREHPAGVSDPYFVGTTALPCSLCWRRDEPPEHPAYLTTSASGRDLQDYRNSACSCRWRLAPHSGLCMTFCSRSAASGRWAHHSVRHAHVDTSRAHHLCRCDRMAPVPCCSVAHRLRPGRARA